MFSRSAVIMFVLLLAMVSTGFAQGDYLNRGESGFGLNVGFSNNSDATGLGGKVSYSINGIADFGLSFTRISFDQKLFGEDLKGTAISPSAAFHLVKQDSINTPVSATIFLGYEMDTYSSKALDALGWDMSGSFWGFGLSLFRNIRTAPTTVLQPSVSAGLWTGTIKVKDSFGNSKNEDDNITAFQFGLSVFLESAQQTSAFRIDPSISFSEGNTTLSLGAGYIFKTP